MHNPHLIKCSTFKPWLGTLHCVPGQYILLSRCLSSPRCEMGTRKVIGTCFFFFFQERTQVSKKSRKTTEGAGRFCVWGCGERHVSFKNFNNINLPSILLKCSWEYAMYISVSNQQSKIPTQPMHSQPSVPWRINEPTFQDDQKVPNTRYIFQPCLRNFLCM